MKRILLACILLLIVVACTGCRDKDDTVQESTEYGNYDNLSWDMDRADVISDLDKRQAAYEVKGNENIAGFYFDDDYYTEYDDVRTRMAVSNNQLIGIFSDIMIKNEKERRTAFERFTGIIRKHCTKEMKDTNTAYIGSNSDTWFEIVLKSDKISITYAHAL